MLLLSTCYIFFREAGIFATQASVFYPTLEKLASHTLRRLNAAPMIGLGIQDSNEVCTPIFTDIHQSLLGISEPQRFFRPRTSLLSDSVFLE